MQLSTVAIIYAWHNSQLISSQLIARFGFTAILDNCQQVETPHHATLQC